MSIKLEDVGYTYNVGTSASFEALRDVSLSVEKGEWLAIVGHTGSGKSTLAQHMNALLLSQRGRVEIDGVEVRAKSRELRTLRKKVGLVFQYPEQQFFAETVREEIAFAPSNWGVSGEELDGCVVWAARAVGLDLALLDSNPFALSGGQRRRVALASVIAMKPSYLVLDEPTAGLDVSGIRELVRLLNEIRRSGLGIVQVTHDLQLALIHSDKILILENGRRVAYGESEEIAEFLLKKPVQGLVIPPLVRFIAAMRERGLALPLTSGLDKVLESLEAYRRCHS